MFHALWARRHSGATWIGHRRLILIDPVCLPSHNAWQVMLNSLRLYISNVTIIGSDNGLAPSQHQAIIWNNANLNNVKWFKKMHFKISSVKWWPLSPGLNVLNPKTKPYYINVSHVTPTSDILDWMTHQSSCRQPDTMYPTQIQNIMTWWHLANSHYLNKKLCNHMASPDQNELIMYNDFELTTYALLPIFMA